VNRILEKGGELMTGRLDDIRQLALEQFDAYWKNEARRLQSLAHQGDISQKLAAVEQRREQGRKILNSQCTSRLDALRIMISVA
jgi:hypothetical protein